MGKGMKLSRIVRSTSVRLSLRFALLYSVVTALVFAMAYQMADYEITEWIEEQLIEEEIAYTHLYREKGLEAVIAQVSKLGDFNFEDHRVFLLKDVNGAHLVGNIERIDGPRASGYLEAASIKITGPTEDEASGYILRNIPLGANTLILGTSTYFVAELLEGLGGGLLIGFAIVLLVGAGAGVAVGRRTEHRLAQISTTLQDVARGNLEARVPLETDTADDLTLLSAEINQTIGHLQKMVESQHQISADIAHDLRTPMQRLRQRLETIGQSPELPALLATAVYEAIDAADDLIETFHALLRISQIEAGARRENFCQVDLVSVLARIEDAYGAVAEEKGQILTFAANTPSVTVSGDQQLLTQMMANVVENALRHCPSDAQIQVELKAQNATVTFGVSDNGPGIPAQEKEKVLRRFYRLEKSRTTSGNGLGLSLVKAVVDLHEARISLTDGHPGLTVSVAFPASPKGRL